MTVILPEYKMSTEQRAEILAMLDTSEEVAVVDDENSHFGEPALVD